MLEPMWPLLLLRINMLGYSLPEWLTKANCYGIEQETFYYR